MTLIMRWRPNGLRRLCIGVDKEDIPQSRIPIQVRRKFIQNKNNECDFCGGKYDKYLYCYRKKGDDAAFENLLLACRLCYMINHINRGFLKECILMYSELSQKEVVRKTVEWMLENGHVPHPHQIDPSVRKLRVSLLEFITVLHDNSYADLPDEMQNYRVFFTEQLDTTFLGAAALRIMGQDSDDETYDISNDSDDDEYKYYFGDTKPNYLLELKLETHELTNRERALLDGCFHPELKHLCQRISHICQEAQEEIMEDRRLERMINKQIPQLSLI